MEKDKIQKGQFAFSIDTSLMFQLGEQLVAKPSIALAELVKNAYDADATQVTITLSQIGKVGGVILIEDNGHGMTFEEVKNYWMRIATTRKRTLPTSRIYHRALTGAKGIGRFATRRLGKKLTLETIAQKEDGQKEQTIATFDWGNSFTPGKDLTDIPVFYNVQPVPSSFETGVKLFIEDAQDAWNEDDLVSLKRDLFSLQTPFQEFNFKSSLKTKGKSIHDPGFDIQLVVEGSGELQNLSGGLGEEFLNAAWASVEGEVNEDGKARYKLDLFKLGQVEELTSDRDYSKLKNAWFKIYYFVYKSVYFEETDFGIRDAQRKGREAGGIRLYLDGFRVFPYGEPGDDWLELDKYGAGNTSIAKAFSLSENIAELDGQIPGRPFLNIPKNNQVFGAVAISQQEHKEIEVNISRERLIETPVVEQLKNFVINGIYWMTLKYSAFVADEKTARKPKSPSNVIDLIEETKKSVIALGIPNEKADKIIVSLDRVKEMAQEEEQERIGEIAMLRILASAGTTLVLMNHQLRAIISTTREISEDLNRLRIKIPQEIKDQYFDIMIRVHEWRDMVELQVSQLGFLLSPESRERKRKLALREIVENVEKPMSYYMKKHGVEFDNRVPSQLRTPMMYEAELYSVFINILSNALKAVYGQAERKIAVEAEKVNGILYIRMLDTGVGLPVERREISFKPFVTTSQPNPILGVGTGLGLKVVRDILEFYGGNARFIDAPEPWKTCIEINLPER